MIYKASSSSKNVCNFVLAESSLFHLAMKSCLLTQRVSKYREMTFLYNLHDHGWIQPFPVRCARTDINATCGGYNVSGFLPHILAIETNDTVLGWPVWSRPIWLWQWRHGAGLQVFYGSVSFKMFRLKKIFVFFVSIIAIRRCIGSQHIYISEI